MKVQQKHIDTLLNYLKEKTAKGEEWVCIDGQTSCNILQMGNTTGCVALQALRALPEIESRPSSIFDGKGKRPYDYRLRANVNSTELKMHTKYRNLTEDIYENAITTLYCKGYTSDKYIEVLNTAYDDRIADGEKLCKMATQIADILCYTINEVKLILTVLLDLDLLEENNSQEELKEAPIVQIQEVVELKEIEVNSPTGDNQELIDAFNNFSELQMNFLDFIKEKTASIQVNPKQVEDLQKQLDEGHKAIEKYIEENTFLNDYVKSLEKELEFNKKKIKVSIEKNEAIHDNMNERFEILIAESMGLISNFANLPAWQRSQATNAKFQKDMITAIQATIADILTFNRTNGKDE